MGIFKILIDALRGILFYIDSIVYGLIPTIYKLIISIANVDLYSNNSAINTLLSRVYIIIGVFMLFKLAFSVLRYIVDPNSFSDSAKGFTGLVRRVVIAILLLVSIPFLFSKIYEYQGIILNTGVLSNLILGTDKHDINDMNEAAVDLQFMMFGPFFSLNAKDATNESDGNELASCAPDETYPLSNIIGSTDMVRKENCLEDFAQGMDTDLSVQASNSTIDKFFKKDGADDRNFSSLGGLLTWTLEDGDYAINYTPVISTICGGYLAFLLLSFCIDIAVRAIKLLFLQILSPVAIISSIDPTTSSQNDKLKEWGMECLKTYISLFLRLIVIYTIIQMMFIITSKIFADNSSLYYDKFEPDSTLNIWVYIFLILGVFSVAKKIPELIEKAFGIKMSGEINMNPVKAFTENTGFQKITALGAGLGIGVAGAATGAGAGRILAGAYNGLKGKNFSEVQRTMVDGNRAMRNAISDGSTFGGRIRARVTKFTGIQGALGKIEDEKVREENEIRRLEIEKAERDNTISDIERQIKPAKTTISNYNNVSSAIDRVKNRAIAKAKETDSYKQRISHAESYRLMAEQATDIHTREVYLNMAKDVEANANRWAAQEGAQEWLNNNADDSEIYSAMREYERAASNAGIQSYNTGQGVELWRQQDELKRDSADIQLSISGQEEQIRLLKTYNEETDRYINQHQEAIKGIDERHRQEEANYKPVGAQSGGPTEPNLTGRADAGQHYGPGGGSAFPPLGGSSGGPGYGGPGLGGSGRGGPGRGGPGPRP